MKTKKSAAKRFKKVSNNSFKHRASNRSHINTKMSTKRKRHLRGIHYVSSSDQRSLTRQLPFI